MDVFTYMYVDFTCVFEFVSVQLIGLHGSGRL